MTTPERWLLLAHAAATLCMVGLIWFVQAVHYPLFDAVGRDGFCHYSRRHQGRTTWVVAGPMLLEASTAALLALRGGWLAWMGMALVVIIWLSTAIWQVPCQRELSCGYAETATRRLVTSNWVRTAAWSARGIIALVMIDQGLSGVGA